MLVVKYVSCYLMDSRCLLILIVSIDPLRNECITKVVTVSTKLLDNYCCYLCRDVTWGHIIRGISRRWR